MVLSKRRLNSHDDFRNSLEKPHNICTTQLVSSTVFESSYFVGSSEQNCEKECNDLLVWLHSLFDIVLIWFFEELHFWQSLIRVSLHLDREKEKPLYQSHRKTKWEFTYSPSSLVFSFVYICTVEKNAW